MARLSRRDILKAAAASTAFPLFTIAGTKASGKVLGANETIRVAVAGINGRGTAHISEFAGIEGVEVAYLVDPDSRLFESRSKQVRDRTGKDPQCVQDIRRVLEDKSVDVVSIATCNHWHSLMTIWACQAGKDVYVEKPISHNVFEGRKCVEAARKYGRIVQHGTQQRSSNSRAAEIAAVQSGKYGKLLVSKGYCCKPRWSIGVKPISAPPSGFDFNLWLGPAPEQPFHGNLHPYNWHWFWDTGNGDIGNQGVHEMDVARWAIKGATLPTRVWSLGGRFLPGEKDQGQTPNMQMAVFEFGDVILLFEVRGLVDREGAPPRNVSNEYYTTEGMIRDGKFYPKNSKEGIPLEIEKKQYVAPGGPFGSFINAVRSRDFAAVNGDAEVAHYSAALCHLANISYRLGTVVPFDKPSKRLGDNARVVESFEAIRENLEAVKIRLAETQYVLGRELTFNPKTERFVGDEEANALLTRPYRAPFVVPEQV
ncbi:MAG: NADH-dependent dehydrogenase [Pirellulaceae bacterium]|nr:MAG: NADH-dependent dehydrogenase [Pirellulaceae bacterium]